MNKVVPNRTPKEYRKDNKDKIRQHRIEYRKDNIDKIKQHKKEYRELNKDKLNEKNKDYYEKNKDEILEQKKEFRTKKPVFGCAKGRFKMTADFDEPLEDLKEYM